MSSSGKNIFFTGSTGFIGQETICRLLQEDSSSKFWLLIRPKKVRNEIIPVEFRLQSLLQEWSQKTAIPVKKLQERFFAVEGDITQDHLGMTVKDYQRVIDEVDRIDHCAADTNFYAGEAEAWKNNVASTRNIILFAKEAAKKKSFDRLNYISTAFVAGKRQGMAYENELYVKQKFHNIYEQTKMLAELLIHVAMDELPITVYRPSMVIGRSDTGWTTNFTSVLQPSFSFIWFNFFDEVPGVIGKSRFDAVSVDYVANAYVYLSRLSPEKVIGKTFHLTVGPERGIFIEDFVKGIVEGLRKIVQEKSLNRKIMYPKITPPEKWNKGILDDPMRRRLMAGVRETFYNYTLADLSFDDQEARKLLDQVDIIPLRMQEYLEKILRFGVDIDFGFSPRLMDFLEKRRAQLDL